MIISLKKLSYGERLQKLGRFSLGYKRFRNAINEILKMIHSTEKEILGNLFYINEVKGTKKIVC